MVKFKSTPTPLEMSIVSNAVEVEPNRIEFGNVTFGCKEIKDASGNVFTKIIRCKNCIHCADDWNGNQPMHTCELAMCGESVQPNDYCSYAERREADNDRT